MSAFNQSICKSIAVVAAFGFLSGCSATSDTYATQTNAADNIVRVDFACEQQVKQREQALAGNTKGAAFLALAAHAERCIDGIQFFPKHPDNKTAMQFNALSVLNYIKAGELQQATDSLADFRKRFPKQDLVLADFTSFVDTATVMLKRTSLSQRQIDLLNINPTLRNELARQQYWSAN